MADDDRLPGFQLLVLCIINFNEAVQGNIIWPFIPFLVQKFGTSEDEIGTYVGFLASSFFLAQLLFVTTWGRLADSIGRRPVLLAGTVGTAFTMALFGFSTNYTMAVVSRFLTGGLNANVAVAKVYMGEITNAKTQARAFSWLSFTWGLGTVSAPAIGGFLADPVTQYPGSYLASIPLLQQYPYVLPALVSASMSLTALILGAMFLPETDAWKRLHEREVRDKKRKLRIAISANARKRKAAAAAATAARLARSGVAPAGRPTAGRAADSKTARTGAVAATSRTAEVDDSALQVSIEDDDNEDNTSDVELERQLQAADEEGDRGAGGHGAGHASGRAHGHGDTDDEVDGNDEEEDEAESAPMLMDGTSAAASGTALGSATRLPKGGHSAAGQRPRTKPGGGRRPRGEAGPQTLSSASSAAIARSNSRGLRSRHSSIDFQDEDGDEDDHASGSTAAGNKVSSDDAGATTAVEITLNDFDVQPDSDQAGTGQAAPSGKRPGQSGKGSKSTSVIASGGSSSSTDDAGASSTAAGVSASASSSSNSRSGIARTISGRSSSEPSIANGQLAPPPLPSDASVLQILSDRGVGMCILNYTLLSLAQIIFDELQPVFCKTDPEQGGLGWSSADVGRLQVVQGAVQIVFQLFLYRKLADTFTLTQLFTNGMWPLVPLTAAWPAMGALARQPTVLWAVISVGIALKAALMTVAFTSIMIAINNSARGSHLGMITGVAQGAASAVRALGPTAGGMMYTVAITAHGLGGPTTRLFVVYGLIGTVAFCTWSTSFAIPHYCNKPPASINGDDEDGDGQGKTLHAHIMMME